MFLDEFAPPFRSLDRGLLAFLMSKHTSIATCRLIVKAKVLRKVTFHLPKEIIYKDREREEERKKIQKSCSSCLSNTSFDIWPGSEIVRLLLLSLSWLPPLSTPTRAEKKSRKHSNGNLIAC